MCNIKKIFAVMFAAAAAMMASTAVSAAVTGKGT